MIKDKPLPLTKVDGVPDRRAVVKGMAHFIHTGPPETHCFQCVWWAFYAKDRAGLKAAPCEKYRKLTGISGSAGVPAGTPSCRYFEARKVVKGSSP